MADVKRESPGKIEVSFVDLCRNCSGEGTLKSQERTFECNVCEGSGRVKITKNITVKVEPYKP